mgnify:FL=1
MNNPAFELIRLHKEVKPDTETLVLKQIRGRVTPNELINIFENGVSGKYGKLYSADPQTLLSWVDAYLKTKHSDKNYLSSGLADPSLPSWETYEWDKEANKCFNAFMNGVKETNFHPAVYDRMICDNKIDLNAYMKYYDGPENAFPDNRLVWIEVLSAVKKAKQKVLKDIFLSYKNKGYTYVYFIRN